MTSISFVRGLPLGMETHTLSVCAGICIATVQTELLNT